MAIGPKPKAGNRPPNGRTPSQLSVVQEGVVMSAPGLASLSAGAKSKSEPSLGVDSELSSAPLPGDATHGGSALHGDRTATGTSTPGLSRTGSLSNMSSYQDEDDAMMPPLERLTIFDLIENLSLPQRLDKIQGSIHRHAERVRRQQQRLKSTGRSMKDQVIEEWRRRLPTADEQLDKYKKRMRKSVDRMSERWNDSKAVTAREKVSFIGGVLNIFISGYLIGAHPDWFHLWYTAQLLYFMPIRFYTYRKKEYHYFLADLCYFVNMLTVLCIWAFPQSKRLFISTYCLAYGNNAVAIAMWRNSLVFHSLDKVVSLFIHIMPCVTLHCLVHLVPDHLRLARFPAIHHIKTSAPDSPEHYALSAMIVWATVPYAIWQLSYHLFISVRGRDKIKAGRPTSFTWLRKSFAPTLIGKFVLSLPEQLQEPAFMGIQYCYAVLTMVPCPLWFWSKHASAVFLGAVFTWSVYNGATFYIDYYGMRFQKELEALKKDVAKWQNSPGVRGKEGQTPLASPLVDGAAEEAKKAGEGEGSECLHKKRDSISAASVSSSCSSGSSISSLSRASEDGVEGAPLSLEEEAARERSAEVRME